MPDVASPSDDLQKRQRVILRSAPFIVPGTLTVLGAAYALVPPLRGLDEPIARVALGARWLAVAMLPYIAVCMTIASSRFRDGAHDPTRGGESPRLQIHCRVMQNHLEQLVWFGVCVLALAPMLTATEARLLPIASVAFVLARLRYWWGYLQPGTIGRAPGVQATLTINGTLLLLTLVLFFR